MDYDQFEIRYDQMPYHQRQEVTRPCGCPHMAGCREGSLVDTNIEAVSQTSMALPDISDGQAPNFDDHGIFLESYQSSASSAYNTGDARTDGASATDLSAFSSSEDEGSPHRHQFSKDAAILQPQYGSNTLREQYAAFHNLGSEPLENNSRRSPLLLVPVQQNRDLFVDPSRLQNRSAGIEDIQQDRFHIRNPKKRRCLLEQSRTLAPQRRTAIAAKSDEDTRIALFSSPTLLQTGLMQLPADLKMPQSVDLELPQLESRNFQKLEATAKLGDSFVQDSLRKSAARTRDQWVPKSPVPCLLPFHGNAVEPKPRDAEKPFACVSGCGQTFARKGDWQRHLTLNWLKSYWQCPSCDKHFARDRSDKLYGKGQHLATAHRRPGEKTNRKRDYHHSISDEKFRKRCGFCGVMCNSFSEFTKHVGEHFRDASSNPPFDMRIWRNSWEELGTASSGDGGDDDSDDNDDDDEKGDGDQNTEDDDYQNQDDSSGGGGGPPSGRDSDKSGGPDYDYGHGPQQDQAPPYYFGNYPPTGPDFMDSADASSTSEMVDDACQDHIESQIAPDDLLERLSNMYLGDVMSRERRRSLSQPHLSKKAAVTSRMTTTKYELWRFKRNGNDWTDTTRDKIPSPQEELVSKTATGRSKDSVVYKQIQAMSYTRRRQIDDLLEEKNEQTGDRWEVAWIKEVRTEKSLTGRREFRVMDVIVARTSSTSRLSLLAKINKSASRNTVSSSRDERVVLKNRIHYSSKDDYNSEKNDKRVKYKDSGSDKRGGRSSNKEVFEPDPFIISEVLTSSEKPLDTSLEALVAVVKQLSQHPHDYTRKRRAISSGPDAGHDTFLKVAERDLQLLIKPAYFASKRSSIGLDQHLHALSADLSNIHILSEYYLDLKPSNILVAQVGTFKITDFGLPTFRSGIEKGRKRQLTSRHTSQSLQGLERNAKYNKANCGKPRIYGQARSDIQDDAESAALVMLKKGEPTTGVPGKLSAYGAPERYCGIEPRLAAVCSADVFSFGCVFSAMADSISSFHEQMTKDQMSKVRTRMRHDECAKGWHDIYDILFPKAKAPLLPYLDDLGNDIVCAFENDGLSHSDGCDLPPQIYHFLKSTDPDAAKQAITNVKKGLEYLLHWKALYAKERLCDALYYVGRREESTALRLSLLDEARNVLLNLTNVDG